VPVVAVIAVQCLRLYFSDAFWERGGGVFFAEPTALVESIRRPHPRLIMSQNVGYFADAHALFDPDFEWLTLENWYPPRGASWYAFSHQDAALMPHYLNLFGAQRVQTFGRAFLVRLEDRDWSWLGEYGWAYERSCAGIRWRGRVPTLHLSNLRPPGNPCEGLTQHVLGARWQAPPRTLLLKFTGTARVTIGGQLVAHGDGNEMTRRFEVATGDTVEVRLDSTAGPGVWLALFELQHDVEALPRWDAVSPATPETNGSPTHVRTPPGG